MAHPEEIIDLLVRHWSTKAPRTSSLQTRTPEDAIRTLDELRRAYLAELQGIRCFSFLQPASIAATPRRRLQPHGL